MHIRASKPGKRTIRVNRIGGDILESPIIVEFSEYGVANVKDGIGEWMLDNFDVTQVREPDEEEDDSSYTQEE